MCGRWVRAEVKVKVKVKVSVKARAMRSWHVQEGTHMCEDQLDQV